MTNKILKMAMASVLLVLFVSCNTSTTMWQLESPDKLVRLVIDQVEEQSETRLVYSIYLKKGDSFKQIMDQSPLGISYAELASSVSCAELASSVVGEESRFVENLEFVLEEKQLNETDSYTLASGKKQQVSNNYNASTLTFQNKDQKQIALVLRTYNYGIAFSYHFPQEAENAFKVTSELTGFDFKEGSFWGHPYDTLSTYTPGQTLGLPPFAVDFLKKVPANIEMIVDGNGAKDLQSAGVAPLDGKITIRMQPYGGFSGSWE